MFTAQWFRFGGQRCSLLNAALVANEENVTKAEFLGLIPMCIWLGFIFQFLTFGLVKIALWFLVWFGFSVSETDLFIESQLCNTVCLKDLFGVVSPFSTAFCVPSGFSDRRFETAPDLSFPKYVKLVLAKRQLTPSQSFRLGN
ncbi:hypothetical protein [Vibrio vulnificus]|uniref:hypothetical protein n=1 Tax=Vibrio vulnificus TaxID=672 RepID=UPI001F050009|nr:hypothetical protein [Vibrio vulnificus]